MVPTAFAVHVVPINASCGKESIASPPPRTECRKISGGVAGWRPLYVTVLFCQPGVVGWPGRARFRLVKRDLPGIQSEERIRIARHNIRAGAPLSRRCSRLLEWSDDVTLVRGAHSLKTGFTF